jgi:hypothetical protein
MEAAAVEPCRARGAGSPTAGGRLLHIDGGGSAHGSRRWPRLRISARLPPEIVGPLLGPSCSVVVGAIGRPSGARICTTGPVQTDGGAFLCPDLPGVRAEMALPLHVITSLGCQRWRCHSVQDHRRKLATMKPMGVMSLPEGIAEVFLHCIPCPCCSTSRCSRISGRRGCPRKGRGGDDEVANQWRLPIFIATTMAAVSHAF